MNAGRRTLIAAKTHVCAAAATGFIGWVVLCGWIFDIDSLKRVVPGLVAMNPVTAVTFLLLSASLALFRDGRPGQRKKFWLFAARACALTGALIGFAKGLALLGGPDLRIDRLFFASKLGQGFGAPNEMAPNTAINFILVGNALWLLHLPRRRGSPVICIASLVCGFEALLVLLGYVYGIGAFHTVHSHIPMALHTAVAFLIITFGIMVCHARHGFLSVITGQNAGGLMARRLLPAIILLPIVLGWLRLEGQRLGFFDNDFGVALYAVTNMLVFGGLVACNAYFLFKTDVRRAKADQQLQRAHEQLLDRSRKQIETNAKLESVVNVQQEIATADLDLEATMNLIVERVQKLTGANGAVIELIEADEMVYRGASGITQEHVGTRLKLASSFSGLCVREGKTLSCADSETDPRVDQEACRRIGVRSMVAAPLHTGDRIVGALKVVSASPAAFDQEDVTALQAMAGLLAAAIHRTRASEKLRERTAKLAESQEQYRLLFDSNPFPVWVFDLETLVFLAVNDAAIQHYGFSRDEFLSMTIKAIRPPESTPALLADIAQLRPDAGTVGAWQHRKKDGNIIDVEITARPISFGGRRGRLVLVNDVTDRLRNDKALEQAKAEADRANHAKSEFLSRMSHELRTPMNAILGFAQLLEMENLTADHKESVGHIIRGGRHLLELINEVLDISRIEAGHLTLSTEPVELGETLRETTELVRPLAADRQITINPLPACELYVLADRQRLKQVLINLISNAIKYNRIHGSVSVHCGEREGLVRISIIDTGAGIPSDRFAQLFTPFERLGAEQGTVEGTGLGLAVTKRLVEAMNGAIGVHSLQGQGTTFWLEFAATKSPLLAADVDDAESPHLHPDPGAKRTVLYIEDNVSNLRLIERVLERRPAVELLSAPDGSRGMEIARACSPSLILLDLNLPDMHGREVLERLKNDPVCAAIPVIAISADAMHAQKERILLSGAADYLTKPLNVKKFLGILDHTLQTVGGPE
jgi:PAS domain S-box-containing protein